MLAMRKMWPICKPDIQGPKLVIKYIRKSRYVCCVTQLSIL